MSDNNFLETLATSLTQTASVKNVFGEPIQAGDKVIIPVAHVIMGMGGGYGHGRSVEKQPDSPPSTSPDKSQTPGGGGGGGGVYAVARGVFEITPTKTRFIPARNGRQQLLISLAVVFLLGRLVAPERGRGAKR